MYGRPEIGSHDSNLTLATDSHHKSLLLIEGSSNIRSPERDLDKEKLAGYGSCRETSGDEVWFPNKPYTNDMHFQEGLCLPKGSSRTFLSARRKMKVSWGNFAARAGRVSAGSWFVAG